MKEVQTKSQSKASRMMIDHFGCPDEFVDLAVRGSLSAASGYFRCGSDTICFGQLSSKTPARTVTEPLHDALRNVTMSGSEVQLPFDPAQVVDNLRHERYLADHGLGKSTGWAGTLIRQLYYLARPFMTVALRKHLQRFYLHDWKKIPFPHWPVDCSVENTLEHLLVLSMKAQSVTRIPFIWFWPEGAPSCTCVTHDVEAEAGWDFCSQLMDLDDSFGIKSAFQIVPEERYQISYDRLDSMRERGFEINVHDLNHDGNLLVDRDEFLLRASGINDYARKFRAEGFRTAVLYRKIDWFGALHFAYDLSVPTVAHLEPQRGGCCTVFPFFNENMLELPVTMAQDYSLFNILNDYSIDLWKDQATLIRKKHGLLQMIVHPDYLIDEKARRVYGELLGYLSDLRAKGETWIALPAEVNAWWRLRSGLKLVDAAGGWQIQGEGHERARIAYARIVDDEITYEFEPSA